MAYTALKPGGTLSFVAPAFRKTPPREAYRKTPINRKIPLQQQPVTKSDLIQMNLSPLLAKAGFSSIRNSTDADASDKTVRSIWGARKPDRA